MKHIYNLDGQVVAEGKSYKDILQDETSTSVHPLYRKYFRRANLRKLNLVGVKIEASSDSFSLRHSDFMGADFSESDLRDAKFCGIDLRAANFTNCNLKGTHFRSCSLDGARFNGIKGAEMQITDCSIRRVKVSDVDFCGAELALIGPGEKPGMPADGATFSNCNFEQVKFRGDWNNAAFFNCDLSNSEPGSYSSRGAVWGVSISWDSNIDGMLTANCSGDHYILPAGDVYTPDEAWDEWGFEVEPESIVEPRHEVSKTVVRDALRAAEAQKKRDAAEAQKKRDAVAADIKRWAEAQKKRDAAAADIQRRAADKITRIVKSPELNGHFHLGSISHKDGVYRIKVEFSAPLGSGYRIVRDYGFAVSNGKVIGARRVNGRSDLWEIAINPDGPGPISIVSTEALRGHNSSVLLERPISAVIRSA